MSLLSLCIQVGRAIRFFLTSVNEPKQCGGGRRSWNIRVDAEVVAEKETETEVVRASACKRPTACLGISLYCSSLLHTPQASLPLPSSLETVQPPNDPNNHTHSSLCFFAKNESESIGDFKKQPKCLWTRVDMVKLCQMQNNHYLPPGSDPSKVLGTR